MAMSYEKPVVLSSAQFDADNTGDKHTFAIPFRCRVIRALVLVNESSAGGATLKFDKTAAGAAAAARGDGDIAAIVIPAADHEGDCFYDDVARGAELVPGDRVTVEVTADAGTAPNVVAMLLVDYIPEEDANLANLVETA